MKALLLLTVLVGAASLGESAAQQHHHAPPPGPGAAGTVPARAAAGRPVLENLSSAPNTVEVELTASVMRLPLVPGFSTEVYAFNGCIPGPTLEVREGDRVIVRFRNDLPEATTVHWHGLHLPFEADGSPFHPVAPGEEYTYEFTVRPGSAGTYWYHPHPHHATGVHVARGLYGGIVVRAAAGPLLATLTERLLILSDNRFHEDGSLDIADPHSPQDRIDFENGREGDVLFVSGEVMPTLSIRSGEVQRWRVVNASAGRFYRLSLPGHTFLHVGSDGGLFEKPLEVEEILLTTAERVELLVRGSAAPGTRAVLQALPYDRYIRQTRPADWERPRELLTLRYTAEPPVAPLTLPEVLRPIPALDPNRASATRLW